MSSNQIHNLVNSDWAQNRSGLEFASFLTARTQLKSYLNASYGALDKETAARCGLPLVGYGNGLANLD